MKPNRRTQAAQMLVLVAVFALAFANSAFASTADRYIVTMKPTASVVDAKHRFTQTGARYVKDLAAAGAVVYMATPEQRDRIVADLAVDCVEPDEMLAAVGRIAAVRTQNSQVLPWGIGSIRADRVWPITTASGVNVAVLDTGLDARHPDLIANVAGGYSAVVYTKSWADDNGHGTHVAGTIAASNNRFGVVGVAPNAAVLGVKVLDSKGRGYVSDVIDGIDWSIAHGAKVINMSFAGPIAVDSFQWAINRATDAGVVVVAAIGDGGTADVDGQFPGAYWGVIGVGAAQNGGRLAAFSSRSPEADVVAPGVDVYSTYWTPRGSSYARMNGTSMASAHVAGLAALVESVPVTRAWDANGNGQWDPTEVASKMTAYSADLGAPGRDLVYGAGYIDVISILLR